MKVKKFIITAMAATMILSLLLASCGKNDAGTTAAPTDAPGSSTEDPSAAPNPGITVNDIEFTNIDPASLDDSKIQLINDMSLTRGFTYWVGADGTYTVYIGLGQRPTAGYGINVLSVEDNEGKTNILVKETKPDDGEMVAQVLTYPYVIVNMTGITDNFNLVDTNDDVFELLYGEDLERHMVVCVYEGLIDGTSIETTPDGKPAFFRNAEMAAKVENLDEGTLVKIIYTTNNEGQMILQSILPLEEDSETIEVSGIYQGLIDGNSLEVLIDGVFMALRNPDVKNMAEGLEKDDEVKIIYSVSEEGQFLLERITPAE